jgi:hypothetical protein
MTDGQMRELAREFCSAIFKAKCPEELPLDGWLYVRFRALGCPDDLLEAWRDRIKEIPLQRLADGAG